ncbi:unnamed protein product [Oikopleura dioica]|uniref:RIIa domain-containing protein n=1 Tax=Oikopleura dioica TaxID=34765 RepID=E4Y2R7_OIKDI|nr:unnamed protein product [Oikopleura dioica]
MSRLKSVEDLEKEIYVEALPLILEGLNELLEKKPKDAMEFLADYFLSKNEPSVPSRISKKTKVVKIPNYEGKTVEDLKNIIESLHITTATYDKLMSSKQEDRGAAALELLTRPDPESLIMSELIKSLRPDDEDTLS